MPFDPNIPAQGAPNSSAQMRGQITGLKDLIDAVQSATSAQVDGTTTLNPGDNATVQTSFDGNNVRFTFGIPRGQNGNDGGTGGQAVGAGPCFIHGNVKRGLIA